jgi:hypothetical protein
MSIQVLKVYFCDVSQNVWKICGTVWVAMEKRTKEISPQK